MTIAVHFSSSEDFYFHCFTAMIQQQPETKFIFISSDFALLKSFTFPNVKTYTIGSALKNIVLKKYWHNRAINAVLKKENPDFFFGTYGISPLTSISQNIIYLENESSFDDNTFKQSISKWSSVIVPNEYVKAKFVESFPDSASDIIKLPKGSHTIPSLDKYAVGTIKKKLVGDKAYFFVDASEASEPIIIQALQSFSAFKKWQHSSFNLILICHNNQVNRISDKLTSYKYRDDVCILSGSDNNDIYDLMSEAYAIIFLCPKNNISKRMAYSYITNVPLLIEESKYHESSFGNSVLFYSLNNLSEKMILIYKNENLRNDLILKAAEQGKELTWDKISSNLWATISKKLEK